MPGAVNNIGSSPGSLFHTGVPPLPGNSIVQSSPSPQLVRKSGVQDGEDTSDYGPPDPGYADVAAETPDNGIFSNAGKGDGDILNDAGSDADAMIYGDDGTDGNGIGDDTIEGDDSILGGPLSDEEMDKVIFGEDGGGLDSIIEGSDPDEMSDTEMDAIIYGEPDEPELPKRKKLTYRVVGRTNRKQLPPPTPLAGNMY